MDFIHHPFVLNEQMPDLLTCQKCGHTRQIRKRPVLTKRGTRWIAGPDEGCPNGC
jgi:hypothetical protein